MEIKYIDIHSHLEFADYGEDLSEVIKRMHEDGVGTITVGTDLKTSIEAVKIAAHKRNTGSPQGKAHGHAVAAEHTP